MKHFAKGFSLPYLASLALWFLAGWIQLLRGEDPLNASAFKYAGAFRPPSAASNGAGFAPVGQSLCYVPGRGTLYIGAQAAKKLLAEISIPTPVEIPVTWTDARLAPYAQLPEAVYVTGFTDPTRGAHELVGGYVGNRQLRGVAVFEHDGVQRLAWNIWMFYNVSATDYPVGGFAPLLHEAGDAEGPWLGAGSQSAGGMANGRACNWVIPIPEGWLPGWDLLYGGSGASGNVGYGPCIYAARFPEAGLPPVTGKFTAQTIADYTGNPHPDWGQTDYWGGAAFLESAGSRYLVILGRKGLGPVFYGDGVGRCYSSKGYHADPYGAQLAVYGLSQLQAVLAGQVAPNQVRYTTLDVTGYLWPHCSAMIGGLAWDGSRYLYLLQSVGAINSSGVWLPVIHRLEFLGAKPADTVGPAAPTDLRIVRS